MQAGRQKDRVTTRQQGQ